jgi:hypothetical protein
LRRFKAPEAHQGVAVDASHFYAIANRAVAKYDKSTGKLAARWTASDERPLIHLNAGIVLEGKLYCAHSNSPGVPATSSVEIWETKSLEHVGTHSFGIEAGSLTWVDRHNDAWWAVFANYSSSALSGGGTADARWTTLIKFDDDWQRREAWVFPQAVLERFAPNSNSGGGWGPGGLIYCTGHDRGELYALRLPKAGSVLEYVETIPVNLTGQAFAWDPAEEGVIWGIDRRKHEVVVSKLAETAD